MSGYVFHMFIANVRHDVQQIVRGPFQTVQKASTGLTAVGGRDKNDFTIGLIQKSDYGLYCVGANKVSFVDE